MIIRYPDGLRAGERSTEIVSVTDVMPTLAEALGVTIPAGIDGESLYRRRVAEDRGVYFESYYGYLIYDWSPITGWIDGRGKYLHSSDPELFDVALDPEEKINLVEERADELERYRTAIRDVASRPVLPGTSPADLDPETQRMISDLGYSMSRSRGVNLPHPLQETGLAAPSTTAEELRLVLQATELLNAGKGQEAEALHRRILEKNPDNYYSLEFLATLLIQRRRFAEAVAPLQRVMSSDRGTASASVNLGICMRATGDEEKAIGWFLKALELDANNVKALRHLHDLFEKQGEVERAEPYAKRYEALTGDEIAR
jgi:tetratricopeptide (TPR) repeat protein